MSRAAARDVITTTGRGKTACEQIPKTKRAGFYLADVRTGRVSVPVDGSEWGARRGGRVNERHLHLLHPLKGNAHLWEMVLLYRNDAPPHESAFLEIALT